MLRRRSSTDEPSPWFVGITIAMFGGARNETFLSVASVWGIAIKVGTGKLELSRPLT